MEGVKSRHHQIVYCNESPNEKHVLDILLNYSVSLDNMENDLNFAIRAYDFHPNSEEQIKLDTFLAYVNSTLFWMYLKLQGSDLSKHYILHDLGRAKEMLAREKQINDLTVAPRLDIAASKRFIAAGIHTRFVDMNGIMVTEAQYKRSLVEADKLNMSNKSTWGLHHPKNKNEK